MTTKLMNEWIAGGEIRARLHAVREIERELAALSKVDFSKGWPRGTERRQLRQFVPDRVLENLSFVISREHELWETPVVRALQVLAVLYRGETASESSLLQLMQLVVDGAAELGAELRKLVHGLDVTFAFKDRVLGPPAPVGEALDRPTGGHEPPRLVLPSGPPLFPQPPAKMKS